MKRFVSLAVLFTLALALAEPRACTAEPTQKFLASAPGSHEKHNIVLIVVDTLGAKHFGEMSAGRSTTPNLSRLAQEGVYFEHAFSGAPWTRPAVGSIFTGYTPLAHGLRSVATKEKFNPATSTLAEQLRQMGYTTAGIVSHILISPETDFARGFDSFRMVNLTKNVHAAVTSDQVSQLALDWLQGHTAKKQGKPFFLFLHYFDPHFNYNRHPEFDRTSWYKGALSPGMSYYRFRRLAPKLTNDDMRFVSGLFQEEIEYTDQQIGRVLEAVRGIAKHENTSVVVVADHGEEFKEHGFVGHGHTMFNEIIHVPLLFWNPRLFKPAKISTWVSTYDIFPTLVPFEAPVVSQEFHGRSLLPSINGNESNRDAKRLLFAEVEHRASIVGVMQEPFKFVFDRRSGQRRLYNLANDPLERTDLAPHDQATTARFTETMESFLKAHEEMLNSRAQEKSEPLLPKEVEALKTLGYL